MLYAYPQSHPRGLYRTPWLYANSSLLTKTIIPLFRCASEHTAPLLKKGIYLFPISSQKDFPLVLPCLWGKGNWPISEVPDRVISLGLLFFYYYTLFRVGERATTPIQVKTPIPPRECCWGAGEIHQRIPLCPSTESPRPILILAQGKEHNSSPGRAHLGYSKVRVKTNTWAFSRYILWSGEGRRSESKGH